ncbi:class C sortase [Brevibacterium sp. HMSC08F02]|uniref:class C sortase n=1 Tax=Brevibacterium sp. HMSC08F02 TaxID=1581140 RepID=UPI0008A1C48F|nr:class C sortase [Brevibacterium sp. HMSC08F02]OFT25836.1 class C sortase [Brevibacterium sp. HMSC08F02]
MKRTVTNGQYGKAKKNRLMLPAIVVILGLLVMMYPVVSTAWNNYGASKAAKEYAQLDKDTPQEVKNTQWDKAHEYNEQRASGPILDPWLNDIDSDNPEYAEYLDQLSENDAMARFIFPKIGVDLPIYHGTSDDVLQRGLGHLYGSDLPVGGRGTHSVITGHTGLSNATMFDNLSKAEEGDAFYVQVSGHKLKYEIDQIKVVLPDQTEDLRPDESGDYITLITCTPYGVNTHRLLVRGHQVPLEPVDEGVFDQNHSGGWQWWMYALMAAVLVIGLGFAWWARRQHKLSKATASANNKSKGLSSDAEKQSDDNN